MRRVRTLLESLSNPGPGSWVGCPLALACLLGLAGCSDLGSPLGASGPGTTSCEIVPSSLDLGSVAVGQSADGGIQIINHGAAGLQANLVASCPDLVLLSGGGAQLILPGDTLEVLVRYSPSTSGPSSCAVLTGLDCAQVDVTANGYVATTVSFAADIQPIFTTWCVSCHGPPAPNAGMTLSAGSSWSNLVNVVSTGYAPAVRVVPGDTTASVLFHKVFGTGQYGATMPLGGSLPQAERDLIRTWIVEGAKEN